MNTNLFNIEELLSIAEMSIYAGRRRNNKIREFISCVIKYYEEKFFSQFKIRSNYNGLHIKGDEIHDLYLSFVCAILKLKFTFRKTYTPLGDEYKFNYEISNQDCLYGVITFNYDTILENILYRINEQCDENQIKLDFESAGVKTNSIRLCKLHGSIDTNTIVPPTWAKTFSRNIQRDWTDAHTLLKEANEIRIIGFSFPNTDSHITYLFKSALIENNNLKNIDILCLDDEKSTVEAKYRNIFCTNKMKFKNENIENYFTGLYAGGRTFIDYSMSLEMHHSKFFVN
jgi:hypothetical protein